MLYNFTSSNLKTQWKLAIDLSNLLGNYYKTNKNILCDALNMTEVTEYEIKSSSSFSCFAWSDRLELNDKKHKFSYLVAGTGNGLIVVWKVCFPCENPDDASIVHISKSGFKQICDIACHKSITKNSVSHMLVLFSNYEGNVTCTNFAINLKGTFTEVMSRLLWREKDYLAFK